MTPDNFSDEQVDAMLSAARETAPVPSAQLLERVMADSIAVQAAQIAPATLDVPTQSRLARWFDSLGGWPAVTGMATATVAGVWVGYVQPDSVLGIADLILPTVETGYGLDDFAPSSYAYLLEGDV